MNEKDLKALKNQLMNRVSVKPDARELNAGNDTDLDYTLTKIEDNAKKKINMKLVPGYKGNERACHTVQDGGTLSIYYLPWLSKRIVGMEVAGDSDIFFTAAINGCSIMVTGDPTKPMVYHAGIGTDLNAGAYLGDDKELKATATAKDAPKFWRLLLTKTLVPGAWEDKNYAEINRPMYVNDGTGSTKRAKDYQKELEKAHKADPLKIGNFAPWGCVYGLRDGGKWAFFLQENATVRYENTKTKKKYATSLVMALTQFYPKGKEKTNLAMPLAPIKDPFTPSELVLENWL
jgi:hypothetical protein